jgi:hypothetical protein
MDDICSSGCGIVVCILLAMPFFHRRSGLFFSLVILPVVAGSWWSFWGCQWPLV